MMLYSMLTLNAKLNDGVDEPGSLSLVASGRGEIIGEFRVGDPSSIPVDLDKSPPGATRSELVGGAGSSSKAKAEVQSKPDERSTLLKCAPPMCLKKPE